MTDKEQIRAQYERQGKAIQDAQIKAENKTLGREIAREKAAQRRAAQQAGGDLSQALAGKQQLQQQQLYLQQFKCRQKELVLKALTQKEIKDYRKNYTDKNKSFRCCRYSSRNCKTNFKSF